MKYKIPLLVCLWCCSVQCWAQFDLFESYFFSDSDLYLHELVTTNDDGYLLVNSRNCYVEGGEVATEGCLIELYLIRINSQGDTLWTSTLPTANSFFNTIHATALSNGQFSVLLTEPSSYTCQGMTTGPFGWDQSKAFLVSEDGVLLEEKRFQEECTLNIQDAIPLENDEQLVLLNYSSEPFGAWNGQLMQIDATQSVVSSKEFPGQAFRNAKLIKAGASHFYTVYQRDNKYWLDYTSIDGTTEWTRLVEDELGWYLLDASHTSSGDIALLFKQATLERDMRVVLFDSTLGIERWSTILDLDGEGILWPLPEAIGIATTSTGDNEDTDITLVELSESGEYLSASVLPLPAFETPKALFLSNGQLGFAGDIVCCDSPESFEPSGVFWGITNFFVVNTEAPAKSPITVEVGPNPFRNRLLIDWEAHQVQMQEIRIFNALGQLIWRQPTPQAPLQIGTMDWPAGSYYLFAQAAEGQSVEKLLLFNE